MIIIFDPSPGSGKKVCNSIFVLVVSLNMPLRIMAVCGRQHSHYNGKWADRTTKGCSSKPVIVAQDSEGKVNLISPTKLDQSL